MFIFTIYMYQNYTLALKHFSITDCLSIYSLKLCVPEYVSLDYSWGDTLHFPFPFSADLLVSYNETSNSTIYNSVQVYCSPSSFTTSLLMDTTYGELLSAVIATVLLIGMVLYAWWVIMSSHFMLTFDTNFACTWSFDKFWVLFPKVVAIWNSFIATIALTMTTANNEA